MSLLIAMEVGDGGRNCFLAWKPHCMHPQIVSDRANHGPHLEDYEATRQIYKCCFCGETV